MEGRCPWNLHFGVWDWKVECRTIHPEVKNRKNSHRWTCLASSLLPRVQPDKEAHGLGWGCAAVSENTSFHSGWEAAPSGCRRMEGKGLKTARTLSSQRFDRKRSRGRCGSVEMVNFHHGSLQNACNYRGKRLRSWGDGSVGEVLSKVPILRTYTVEYIVHLQSQCASGRQRWEDPGSSRSGQPGVGSLATDSKETRLQTRWQVGTDTQGCPLNPIHAQWSHAFPLTSTHKRKIIH